MNSLEQKCQGVLDNIENVMVGKRDVLEEVLIC
jgi:hypothetical protein